jgi:hypothetical protein
MLASSEEKKKAVSAKKYLEGVEESVNKLDAKAAELSATYEATTKEQLKLKEQEVEITDALNTVDDEKQATYLIKKAEELIAKIKALGAKVILSRDGDTTVSLYERMDLLTATDPDLSISVHHNSVNETKNANTARGTWGLYWSPSGISLTDHVRRATVEALGYYDYGTKAQKLALCRNHRFPQTLVEVGFICAPAEFQTALRRDYSNKVAEAISEGVLSWYRTQDSFRQGITQ